MRRLLVAAAACAAAGVMSCAPCKPPFGAPRCGSRRAIVLLDLNYTFVKNQQESRKAGGGDFTRRITHERYRKWLGDFLRDDYVIMITARPEEHRQQSLANIRRETGWTPDEAYFNEKGMAPPECKKDILERCIFPRHGSPGKGTRYVAIESNPRTAAMYESFGIPALKVWDPDYAGEAGGRHAGD